MEKDIPTLRMDLSGVSYHVVTAFEDKFDEIKNYAVKNIEAAIKTLTEQGGLEKAIQVTVQDAIQQGLHEGIHNAVNEGIYDYFNEGEGKEFVAKAIIKQLRPEKE